MCHHPVIRRDRTGLRFGQRHRVLMACATSSDLAEVLVLESL